MSIHLIEDGAPHRDSLYRLEGMMAASPRRGISKSRSAARSAVHSNVVERLTLLQASSLFAGLSELECTEVAACALVRSFVRDESLFTQGQPVTSLILLQSGSVKHTQVSPGGNEALLRISSPGDVVSIRGESGSFCHTCSARAIEKCSVLVWEYDLIQRFLTRYPKLAANTNRVLAARLQDLEERFREVATEKVARRLALLLIRLHRQIGKQCGQGVQIALNRDELAKMTGATVFTVSRLLSKWSRLGVILTHREMIIVSDRQRLETLDELEGQEPEGLR